MAASRDFNAFKGTERITIYNVRQPCYSYTCTPSYPENSYERVYTHQPYQMADMHHGQEPLDRTHCDEQRCDAGAERCEAGAKTGKHIKFINPAKCRRTVFNEQDKHYERRHHPKRGRNTHHFPGDSTNRPCSNPPVDPRTACDYPNVKKMVAELEENVCRYLTTGDCIRSPTSAYLHEPERRQTKHVHLRGPRRMAQPVVSSQVAHCSSYEKLIRNYSPASNKWTSDSCNDFCPCCPVVDDECDSSSSSSDDEICPPPRMDCFTQMNRMLRGDPCARLYTVDCIFERDPDKCQRRRNRWIRESLREGQRCCCECPPPPPPPPPPQRRPCICPPMMTMRCQVPKRKHGYVYRSKHHRPHYDRHMPMATLCVPQDLCAPQTCAVECVQSPDIVMLC